jgi:hypothetical protein
MDLNQGSFKLSRRKSGSMESRGWTCELIRRFGSRMPPVGERVGLKEERIPPFVIVLAHRYTNDHTSNGHSVIV